MTMSYYIEQDIAQALDEGAKEICKEYNYISVCIVKYWGAGIVQITAQNPNPFLAMAKEVMRKYGFRLICMACGGDGSFIIASFE